MQECRSAATHSGRARTAISHHEAGAKVLLQKSYAELIGNYQNYWIKSQQDNKMIIDADYYNNPSNEGEIFLQVLNLSPYDIVIQKGECIGQGIVRKYYTTTDDTANAMRTGGFGSTS